MNLNTRYSLLFKRLHKLESKLDNLILYVDFFPNKYDLPIVLLKDNSVLVLFELTGLNYEGLTEREKAGLTNILKNAVEMLEEGCTLSNYYIREPAHPAELLTKSECPEIIRFLQENKREFWRRISEKSFTNRIVCCLKYRPPQKLKVKMTWKSLLDDRRTHYLILRKIEKNIEKLYQGYTMLRKALEVFGVVGYSKTETFNALYYLVNRALAPRYRADLSLNVQLAQSHFEFKRDYLKINDEIFSTVVAIKYPPQETYPVMFEGFFSLNFPFVIVQNYSVVNYPAMEKKLLHNKNVAISLSALDKMANKFVTDLEDFQEKVHGEKESVLEWSFYIVVNAGNLNRMRENVLTIKTILKELGSFGFEEKYNLPYALFSTFPGHEKMSSRRSVVLSSNAGETIAAFSLSQGDLNPLDFFIDRQNSVFGFNPFSYRENAHHMMITGPTGSGKSFFANKMIYSCLTVDPNIYVIDLSRSFSELFDMLRNDLGQETSVFSLSNEKIDFRLNPFLIEDLEKGVQEDQLRYCEGLLKLMIGQELITADHRVVLRKALEQFFREYRSNLANRPQGGVGESPAPPPLSNIVMILKQFCKDARLSSSLEYWTRGERGGIFNSGCDNLRASKYCYFDIQNIETNRDETLAVIYVIFDKILKDIRDESKRKTPKMLILDEAHRYLKVEEFSFWIDLLIRIGRHYNLMICLITQSINDLISSDAWSKGIITNLKQAVIFGGQNNVEGAFEQFQMGEKHLSMYNSLISERREFLYWSSGGIRRILANLTDPFTYWMATTDPLERSYRDQVKGKFCDGDARKALGMCVEITKGCGSLSDRQHKLKMFLENSAESLVLMDKVKKSCEGEKYA